MTFLSHSSRRESPRTEISAHINMDSRANRLERTSLSIRKRQLSAALSTLLLLGYTLPLVPAGAQTDTSNTPEKNQAEKNQSGKDPSVRDQSTKDQREDQREDPSHKKSVVPPPGNPLVLLDSKTGNGLGAQDLNKDGTPRTKPENRTDYGDHSRTPKDPRVSTDPLTLPLYGYSYFAPARLARQRYLEQNFGFNSNFRQSTIINTSRKNTEYGTRDNGMKSAIRTSPGKTNPDIDEGFDTTTRRQPINADDNDEETLPPRRRVRRSDDSSTDDSSDISRATQRQRSTEEPQNDPPTRRRVRNTDTDENDPTNADTDYPIDDPALASALRAEDFQHEQRRRQLLGLPPLPPRSTNADNRTTGRANNIDSQSSRRRTAPYGRYANDQTDFTSNELSSNGIGSNGIGSNGVGFNEERTGNQPERRQQSAFNAIIDPITQMTNNIIASAPTTYQLSGGDEITIHITTPRLAPRTITRKVETTGYLDLDEMGRYIVRGKTLEQVEKELQQAIGSRYYRNAVVSLNLTYLRTMSVTVQGETVLPGTYSLPSVASAFNVLYAAGGPTDDGTLRDIKVIRGGKEIGTLDFYKFMNGTGADIPLQSGDIISVGPAGTRVAILGEVRRPARYEMRDEETLKDLLAYSGGAKASGVDQVVQLNTVEPGQNRVLRNINLQEKERVSAVHLYDGDSIEIHSVRQIVENKVTVKGAVTQPGDYALTPGMRVADLLRMARNPLSEAYLGKAALKRWNPDNTTTLIPIDIARAMDGDTAENRPLMKWDSLEIYTQNEASFVGTRKVFINGAVPRPGNYEYSQNMRISDILLRAGGPLKDAEQIELLHQRGDHTYKIDHIQIADIMKGDRSADLPLEDNDIVAVYSNKQAGYIPDHQVRIEGEVNTPGIYPRGEGMRLTDLLRLAGRFRPGANPKVVIAHARRVLNDDSNNNNTHIDTKHIVTVLFDTTQRCAPQDDLLMEDGDVVTVQGTGGLEDRPSVIRVIGAVNSPGPIILKSKNQRLSDAIREAGGLRPEAFPEGAEFNRDPNNLNSKTQRELAVVVGQLNDLLNDSKYKAEQGKSVIERAKALSNVGTESLTTGSGTTATSPAGAAFASELGKHDLVTPPRRLTGKELDPSGNIAINLPAALDEAQRATPKGTPGEHDILLKDGDTIIVPEKPTTIQVVGAVTNPRGILFAPNKGINFYVSQAGDYTPDAAKDRIIVIHYGGGITPGKDVKLLRPGDVILVPTRVLAEKIQQNRNGFGDFFRSITNSAILFRLSTGIFGL